ncbi:MAG: phosphodiester glycosidase family protein [Bacteroidota bacterium]
MRYLYVCLILLAFGCGQGQTQSSETTATVPVTEFDTDRIITHVVDLQRQKLTFFWRDEANNNYGNFIRLRKTLTEKGETLRFAMNGGMYLKDGSPQGLFIQNGTVQNKVNRKASDYGNFYLQPNGIFYLTTEGKAIITRTDSFHMQDNIAFATQSGPMLVIDGKRHPIFTEGSQNVHFRNGVGILPDGRLLFALSKETINFYDFSGFFLQHGCQNALYLDGFVSRMYLPEKNWVQEDGQFGVIIAETVDNP